MSGQHVEGCVEKYADCAELLGARFCGVALGGLFLQHQGHDAGEAAFEDCCHPGSGYGVGKVGYDLVVFDVFGEIAQRVVEGIAFDEMEIGSVGCYRFDMGSEGGVEFDGVHDGARVEESLSEGAKPRADFDHVVSACDFSKVERFADDISVDEEILPELLLGAMTKLFEQVACL